MVLPISTEGGADYIAKMSSARAADTQAQYTSAKADQQMYETQEYISDTQKNLRKQKALADTYTAQVEQIRSKVILDNPDLYRQVIESGMGAQLQQSMAAKGQAYNERITNIFGPGISSSDEKGVEEYKAKYSNALKIDPSLVEGLPSLEDVSKNPGVLIPKLNMLVGTAWENNAKYLQAVGEANVKSQAELLKEMYKQGQMNSREGFKQDRSDRREYIKGGIKQNLLGTEYGLKEGLEGVRQGNRIGLEGVKQEGRVQLQSMKDNAALQRAKIRAKSAKEAQPQLSAVGLAAPKNYMESMVLPAMTGIGLSEDDMDENSRKDMSTELFAKTQQVYLDEFYAHQANPDKAPPPRAPGEITKGLIEGAIADGQLTDTGTFGTKWEYLKAGSDAHITNWIDMQGLNARQKVALNGIVRQLKQQKGFDELSWDDKKDLIISAYAKKSGAVPNRPQSSNVPTAAGSSYAYDEEEDTTAEDDEEES